MSDPVEQAANMSAPETQESASPTEEPKGSDRRAAVRHPRRFEILWQMLGIADRKQITGEIFDLSATGIGMVLNHEFPVQSVLVLRLPSATMGWSSHLVRIRHCRATPNGLFQVGCSFVKPLSDKQLEEHLL